LDGSLYWFYSVRRAQDDEDELNMLLSFQQHIYIIIGKATGKDKKMVFCGLAFC
jgi:hypothetical protein